MKKQEHLLQAFLKPLWADLEECFVTGFPVRMDYHIPTLARYYSYREPITVQVMTTSWTRDDPAQCKIRGTLQLEYNGCRRDFLHAESLTPASGQRRKVVYNKNREQARFLPVKRNIEGMHFFSKCLREASNVEERADCRMQRGLSHFSSMWVLYDMHGFDISLDLVNDPMHCWALRLLKTYSDRLLLSCSNQEVKTLVKILWQVTSNRPVGLGARWPRELLRVKNLSGTSSKWKFFHYKAEEHLLFTMYCVAPILEELRHTLGSPLGDEGTLLIHLSRLFFLILRKHRWSNGMLETARIHCLAWRVLTEELYSPNGKIVEHVIGNGEILDDIKRHGHHDIFWRYGSERMVSRYNNITTNGKSSELSFALYFCRQQFLELFSQVQQYKDFLQRDQRMLNLLHFSLYPRIVGLLAGETECAPYYSHSVSLVTSIKKAFQLSSSIAFLYRPELPSVQASTKGIGIGPHQGSEVEILADGSVCLHLQKYWSSQNLLSNSNHHQLCNRIERLWGVVVSGGHYRLGDLVVV